LFFLIHYKNPIPGAPSRFAYDKVKKIKTSPASMMAIRPASVSAPVNQLSL
jgi:hypothetical protein